MKEVIHAFLVFMSAVGGAAIGFIVGVLLAEVTFGVSLMVFPPLGVYLGIRFGVSHIP